MSIDTAIRMISVVGLIVGLSSNAAAVSDQEPPVDVVALSPDVKDGLAADVRLTDLSVQRPSLPQRGAPATFSTALQLDGEIVTLNLSRHAVLAEDFRVFQDLGGGEMAAVPLPEVPAYRGVISGQDGVRVAATLRGQQLHATILADNTWWIVEPLDAAARMTSRDHIVYPSQSQMPQALGCPLQRPGHPAPPVTRRAPQGTGTQTAKIAFDADVEFFEDRGSVHAVMIDIVDHMNAVGLIYEQQVGISYEISTVIVRTAEPDPYSSTSPDCDQCPDHSGPGLIDEFADEWNAHQIHIERDTAHLLTGKDMNGDNIGRAFWFGRICDVSESYAYSELRFGGSFASRAKLIAHELGHLWDAPHCDDDPDCHVMCSSIGGCTGVADQFGSATLASISAYQGQQTCLAGGPNCRRYAALPGDFDDFGEATGEAFDCPSQLFVAPGFYHAGVLMLPPGSDSLRVYAPHGSVVITDN